ncbi:MAG TPA: hypothetical protein VMS00_13950 [Acidimicrobiales bacterium]|nr:hypothetical protein [Acidimicrobiales bacterium]
MTTRQLRKAAPGTTVAERDLVAGGVNKAIARYASFGWEAVDVAALRTTYSLTGGLFFHRHGITIMFRKLAVDALQPDLLPERGPEPVAGLRGHSRS